MGPECVQYIVKQFLFCFVLFIASNYEPIQVQSDSYAIYYIGVSWHLISTLPKLSHQIRYLICQRISSSFAEFRICFQIRQTQRQNCTHITDIFCTCWLYMCDASYVCCFVVSSTVGAYTMLCLLKISSDIYFVAVQVVNFIIQYKSSIYNRKLSIFFYCFSDISVDSLSHENTNQKYKLSVFFLFNSEFLQLYEIYEICFMNLWIVYNIAQCKSCDWNLKWNPKKVQYPDFK